MASKRSNSQVGTSREGIVDTIRTQRIQERTLILKGFLSGAFHFSNFTGITIGWFLGEIVIIIVTKHQGVTSSTSAVCKFPDGLWKIDNIFWGLRIFSSSSLLRSTARISFRNHTGRDRSYRPWEPCAPWFARLGTGTDQPGPP